jgi:tripartite-type tricarboxylate transporter receptor subunit TctC
MLKWLKYLRLVIAAALAISAASAARAQDPVAEFYRGKSINLIVGGAVGGGLDNYARLLARHMGKFIPGNPAIIAQNMPGAAFARTVALGDTNAIFLIIWFAFFLLDGAVDAIGNLLPCLVFCELIGQEYSSCIAA